ncbi:MAG: HutD family protein [Albidovulum sp.]
MQIIHSNQFLRQPWKNGGGVTHEIAKAMKGDDLLWRLSMADVAADGPFSFFPGLTRSLTVIEGDGIDLETPDGPLTASPLAPVRFSGDTPVTGRLHHGPIRDLNLIFDAGRITATVTPLTGPLAARKTAKTNGEQHLFCVAGPLTANGHDLPPLALASDNLLAITLGPGAKALLIHLSPAPP